MLVEALLTARDLGRLHEIAVVLIRHGLGDLVRRLGLADALQRAGRTLHWEQAGELTRLEPPVQLRRALEELGPTFVKLGQILAGRSDLLGPEWTGELARLHSRVPPVPPEELRAQLREDLGDEPEAVFARFDAEPLAAASMGQVHRARLQDGTEVVVKVRRPGIRRTVEADLRLLRLLAQRVERDWPALRPYRPRELVREFSASLRRELDLAAECRHAERVAENFREQPWIVIPRVHWAWSGERVNVQDWIDGIPGEDLERLDREGLDRRELARRGARAVLKMIVEDGFFHADPHPGNVLYLAGNRVAFIDFGMVGRLSEPRRGELLQLLLGLVGKDAAAVTEVLLGWVDPGRRIDAARLADEIDTFVDRYHDVPLEQLQLGPMLADMSAILREHRLVLPRDLALLVKAFVSLEGMGRRLAPDFQMAREALPLLRQAMQARLSPQRLGREAARSLRQALQLLQQAPRELRQLLHAAREGRLQVQIEVRHLDRLGERLDRAANRLTLGMVVAALIVGSSIVMTVQGGPTLLGLPAFGLVGFVVAVLGGLVLLRSIWRSGHEDRGDEDREG